MLHPDGEDRIEAQTLPRIRTWPFVVVCNPGIGRLSLVVVMVVKLSLACWDYDRVKALEDDRVRPEGISLTFLNYRVEET